MKDKRSSYAATAGRAAEHILGSKPEPFAPKRMSKYANWFSDPEDTCVIAVVMPGEKATVGDEVLAYGLSWQHNRDLHLVLPNDMVVEALTRKAWIDTEVRIWQYDGDGTPQAVPSVGRFQLFSHLRDLPPRKSKAAVLTNEHESWLAGIETVGLTKPPLAVPTWWPWRPFPATQPDEDTVPVRMQTAYLDAVEKDFERRGVPAAVVDKFGQASPLLTGLRPGWLPTGAASSIFH